MEFRLNDKRRLQEFKKLTEDRLVRFTRMAGIQAYATVSEGTPVKTGRAREGWYCSVNVIDRKVPPEQKFFFDPLRASQAFASIKAGDTLYLANSVPYIDRLNKGYSTQKPARFVETTVITVQQQVNQLVKEVLKQE